MTSSSDHVPQFEQFFDDAGFDLFQIFVAGIADFGFDWRVDFSFIITKRNSVRRSSNLDTVAVYQVFDSQSISPMFTIAV